MVSSKPLFAQNHTHSPVAALHVALVTRHWYALLGNLALTLDDGHRFAGLCSRVGIVVKGWRYTCRIGAEGESQHHDHVEESHPHLRSSSCAVICCLSSEMGLVSELSLLCVSVEGYRVAMGLGENGLLPDM